MLWHAYTALWSIPLPLHLIYNFMFIYAILGLDTPMDSVLWHAYTAMWSIPLPLHLILFTDVLLPMSSYYFNINAMLWSSTSVPTLLYYHYWQCFQLHIIQYFLLHTFHTVCHSIHHSPMPITLQLHLLVLSLWHYYHTPPMGLLAYPIQSLLFATQWML